MTFLLFIYLFIYKYDILKGYNVFFYYMYIAITVHFGTVQNFNLLYTLNS